MADVDTDDEGGAHPHILDRTANPINPNVTVLNNPNVLTTKNDVTDVDDDDQESDDGLRHLHTQTKVYLRSRWRSCRKSGY